MACPLPNATADVPAVKVKEAHPVSVEIVATDDVDATFVGAVAATRATVLKAVVGVVKHQGTG